MTSKEFRFNATRVFLTYSQTPKKLNPQVVLRHLSEKAGVDQYLISQETHKDGGYHIHAYLKFSEKIDTRDPRFFDIDYWRVLRHPNISKVTEVHKLWAYIKKAGNYITNIDETRPPWQAYLEDSKDEKEFLTNLMWDINRIDNYAGYRTIRDLFTAKLNDKFEKLEPANRWTRKTNLK